MSAHRETKAYLIALLVIFAGLFAITVMGCRECDAQVYQMRHYVQRCQNGRCTEQLHGNYSAVCIGVVDDGYAILSAGHCYVAEENTKLARIEINVDGQWEAVKYRRARYQPDGEIDLACLEYRGERQLRSLPIETEGERFGATVSGFWNGKSQLVDWDVNAWTQGGDIYFDMPRDLAGVSGGAIVADGELVGILSRFTSTEAGRRHGGRYRNSNYVTIRKFCEQTWGRVPAPPYEEPVPDPLPESVSDTVPGKLASTPRISCRCQREFEAVYARLQQIELRVKQIEASLGRDGEPGAPGEAGRDGQDGRPGLPPEHEVNADGTAVRFRQPGGEWGAWVETNVDADAIANIVLAKLDTIVVAPKPGQAVDEDEIKRQIIAWIEENKEQFKGDKGDRGPGLSLDQFNELVAKQRETEKEVEDLDSSLGTVKQQVVELNQAVDGGWNLYVTDRNGQRWYQKVTPGATVELGNEHVKVK